MKKDVLLNVENLIVQYVTDYGVVEAVNDVSFQVYRGAVSYTHLPALHPM